MRNTDPVRRKYDLEDRFIAFGALVCRLTQRMGQTPVGKHAASQLIRSGTSPLANYGEAQAAESRRDFVHKLRIVLKELRETSAWLRFVRQVELCSEEVIGAALQECDQLIAITVASIRTATRGNSRM